MNALAQSPPKPGPTLSSMTSGLVDSWLEAWAVSVSGLTDCFAAALSGASGPMDVPRWLELIGTRRAPSWTSPNEIVFELSLIHI